MTQPIKTTNERPIQRTLIVSLGPLATSIQRMLPPAFATGGVLAGAVALLEADGLSDDLAEVIRQRLATISRAGGRAELAAAGYVLDRLRELALFILVDLTDPAAAPQATAVTEMVSNLAQQGWGLDTRVTAIALAADWADEATGQGLRTLAEAMQDIAEAIIPLNHVNEEGLELNSPEAFARAGATVVEVLAATPMRDALQWSESAAVPSVTGISLTAVGLSRWTWSPEPARDAQAAFWQSEVINQWLAPAQAEQNVVAAQRAGNWFDSQSLLPQTLTASLEDSVPAYEVPTWSVPYPWQAAAVIHRLRNLSAALAGGRAGAVELVLTDREEWATEQVATLRNELAGQLDREPVAGFDLGNLFLKELGWIVDNSAGVVAYRQDQLEEQVRDLAGGLDETLGQIDAILQKWPPGSPAGWLSMIFRPWRWPGLIWEYWLLHNLARELGQLVARQVEIEREQVVMAAVTALYQRYKAVIDHTVAHLDEVADMLYAARPPAAFQQPGALLAGRLAAVDNPELEAAEAAAALGGLGRLALKLDEELIQRLRALGLERFRFLADLPAAHVLEQILVDKAAIAGWWTERWSEATPLWLYDDVCQPEENRGMERNWSVISAAGADRLKTWLDLPDRPDWRWIPTHDKYHIDILRLRTGVTI